MWNDSSFPKEVPGTAGPGRRCLWLCYTEDGEGAGCPVDGQTDAGVTDAVLLLSCPVPTGCGRSLCLPQPGGRGLATKEQFG